MMFKYVVLLAVAVFTRAIEESQTELSCGKNETLNPQALPCVAHCTFRHFTSCPYPPKPACECKEGFIRSTSNGPCIAMSDCRFVVA